jgi:SAM-dependent methyltransferase
MTLTRAQAKSFYDRFGSKQDWQGFYEDRAVEDMIVHSAFDEATGVLEYGCGTGRLAETLLTSYLPPNATYRATDISSTMVLLAQRRLRPFGDRAIVFETPPHDPFAVIRTPIDRIVSTYVLDLLSETEMADFISQSARLLVDRGRICLVSLTFGIGPFSRLISRSWQTMFRLNARIVGGCRPIRLLGRFPEEVWSVVHHNHISVLGVCSEVLVAEKIADPGDN